MDEFFKIEYTGKIKRTGKIFDTTDKEKAKEDNIYNEKLNYGPRVVTNEEEIVEGVLEELEDMEEDEEKEIEVPAEKGYGERDSSKVEMVPKKDFEDTKVNPVPGLQVVLDGEPAKIQTVSGGRVRVDFNHPMAGKELEYYLKLLKIANEDEKKVKFLTEKLLSLDEEEIETSESEDTVEIEVPEESMEEDKEELREKLEEEVKNSTDYEEVKIKEKDEKVEEEESEE